MKNDENGAMFVEASLVLPIFMIAVLSFIYLISLYTVHSKMQYAISQTANETAVYCYFYSYLGIREVNGKIQQINTENMKSTDEAVGNMVDIIDTCSSALTSLSSDMTDIKNGNIDTDRLNERADELQKDWETIKGDADKIEEYIDTIIDDPKVMIKWLLGYFTNSAVENGKTALGSYVIFPALTYKYLGYSGGDKEAFLKKMGVSEPDFTNSSLLPQIEGNTSLNNRVVDVVVTYDYTPPFSVLPREASTFHIVQRAVSMSWGDGDDTYKYPA